MLSSSFSKLPATVMALCMALLMSAVHSTVALKNDTITCQVSVTSEVDFLHPTKLEFLCIPVFATDAEEKAFPSTILLNPSASSVKANKEALDKGEWYISVPSGWFTGDHALQAVDVPFSEELTTIDLDTIKRLIQKKRSRLNKAPEKATSNRQMRETYFSATSNRQMRETYSWENALIVLVSAKDVGPNVTASEAKEIVFGNGDSAASQFAACSFGEFELVPFGEVVIEVEVDDYIGQYDKNGILLAAQSKACEHFNLESSCNPAYEEGIDHVIYVIPLGLFSDISPYGFGKAEIGGTYSLFQEPAFAPETILHEFGHNFFLGHAGENASEYGDTSGQMGYSLYLHPHPDNGYKRCFNGWNMWEMGWLKDRRYEIDPNVPEAKILATFADYNLTSSDQYVNIKVGEYFITYNRQKGINSGTKKHIDKVLVVETVPDENEMYAAFGYNDTDLVAALDTSTTTYTAPNYSGGKDLIIKVCGMVFGPPDYAIIAAGLGADCPWFQLSEPMRCSYGKPNGEKCKKHKDCCSKHCTKTGKKKHCVSSQRRGRKGSKSSSKMSSKSKGHAQL